MCNNSKGSAMASMHVSRRATAVAATARACSWRAPAARSVIRAASLSTHARGHDDGPMSFIDRAKKFGANAMLGEAAAAGPARPCRRLSAHLI